SFLSVGRPPPPRSGAADALQQFATNAQEMLRLGRDPGEALFVVGQATHFVQNLNQPLHAGWGETRAEHNEIEDALPLLAERAHVSWLRALGHSLDVTIPEECPGAWRRTTERNDGNLLTHYSEEIRFLQARQQGEEVRGEGFPHLWWQHIGCSLPVRI